jgi:hypothetical protein
LCGAARRWLSKDYEALPEVSEAMASLAAIRPITFKTGGERSSRFQKGASLPTGLSYQSDLVRCSLGCPPFSASILNRSLSARQGEEQSPTASASRAPQSWWHLAANQAQVAAEDVKKLRQIVNSGEP